MNSGYTTLFRSHGEQRMACLGHISKYPITANSISWRSQKSRTFTLVMVEIVVVMIPISTSPFNINSCFLIVRGIVAGILWTRSTSINISSAIMRVTVTGQTWHTFITSAITWGRLGVPLRPMTMTFAASAINWVIVYGIKRPMSATFLSQRHLHIFIFRNFFTVDMNTCGRMAVKKVKLQNAVCAEELIHYYRSIFILRSFTPFLTCDLFIPPFNFLPFWRHSFPFWRHRLNYCISLHD